MGDADSTIVKDRQNSLKIEPQGCILCDFIRQEDSGKNILIGVYGGEISVAEFPANLALQVYISAKISGAGAAAVETELRAVSISTEEELATMTITGEVKSHSDMDRDAAFPNPHFVATLKEPCTVYVRWRQGNGEWYNLASKRVELQET